MPNASMRSLPGSGSTSSDIGRPEIIINHATVRERMDMAAFLPAVAARGMQRVSVWGDEIERIGVARARALLNDTGLTVFGYNRAGPLCDGAQDAADLLDRARREIDRAAEFGADHILIFPGGLAPGDRDLPRARAGFEVALARLRDHAAGSGVTLALEPLHPMVAGDRSTLVTLGATNDLCDRLGAGIGIVIDAYHVWWDERLAAEVARAAGRICGFHVNDWLVPTSHILRDRGMMGDGVIDLAGMWQMVRAAGAAPVVEVEIFSDRWWAAEPEDVLDLCHSRCRSIFG